MFSVKNIGAAVVGAVAIGLSVGSVAPAEAACLSPDCKTVTYEGFSYDINTITGTFKDLESILTQQPWWGSESDAAAFASLVAGDLGFPNVGLNFSFGPLFAFAIPETPPDAILMFTFGSVSGSPNSLFGPLVTARNETQTYAVATSSVPIPTPALLPGLVGMGIAAMRKKRQSEASEQVAETAKV
ncbi:MAG: hypothetical protein Kow00121_30060 [Elainellaceae cyanobacterium]